MVIQELSNNYTTTKEPLGENSQESLWDSPNEAYNFGWALRRLGAVQYNDDQSIQISINPIHPNLYEKLGPIAAAGVLLGRRNVSKRHFLLGAGITVGALAVGGAARTIYGEAPAPNIPQAILEDGLTPDIQQTVTSFLKKSSTKDILTNLAKKSPDMKLYGTYDTDGKAPRAIVDQNGEITIISSDEITYELPQIPGYKYSVDIKTGEVRKTDNKKINPQSTGTPIVHETPPPAKATITVTHTATRTPVATVELTSTPTATTTETTQPSATATKTNKLHTIFLPIGGGKTETLGLYQGEPSILFTVKNIDGRLVITPIKSSWVQNAPYPTDNPELYAITPDGGGLAEPWILILPDGTIVFGGSSLHYDDRIDHPYNPFTYFFFPDGTRYVTSVLPDIDDPKYIKNAHEPSATTVKLDDGTQVVAVITAETDNPNSVITTFTIKEVDGKKVVIRDVQEIPMTGHTKRTPVWLSGGSGYMLSGPDGISRVLTALVVDDSAGTLTRVIVKINQSTGKVATENPTPISPNELSSFVSKAAYLGKIDAHLVAVVEGTNPNTRRLGIREFGDDGKPMNLVVQFSEGDMSNAINKALQNKKSILAQHQRKWSFISSKNISELDQNRELRPTRNNKFTGWIEEVIMGNKDDKDSKVMHVLYVIMPVTDEDGTSVMGYFKTLLDDNNSVVSTTTDILGDGTTNEDFDPFRFNAQENSQKISISMEDLRKIFSR